MDNCQCGHPHTSHHPTGDPGHHTVCYGADGLVKSSCPCRHFNPAADTAKPKEGA